MNLSKLRRQIAWEAAKLMFERQESEYFRAKMKAARRICKDRVKPKDLPSNAEIRDEILNLSRMFDGDNFETKLRSMRIQALRTMEMLENFRPRLIGSVLTGHIRRGSDIDLHLFSDSLEPITGTLEYHSMDYDVQRKEVTKHGETNVYRHIHIRDEFPIELTVYPSNKAHYVFKSSITGKAIERASIKEFRQLLAKFYPEMDIEQELTEAESKIDRFQLYYSLLLPLENVKQNLKYHPEGDALYHSLQVFDLACDQLPYDEEFLTAALLHDVGKGIDPMDHVGSGLEALEGFITERTQWLIEHHMLAHKYRDGSLGARARRRLERNENFEDLIKLSECDHGGRQAGVECTDLEEALDYIRELADQFG